MLQNTLKSCNRAGRAEVWCVPPVPFTRDFQVDCAALNELTDFYLQRAVDGLFLLAFSGEGLAQTKEHRATVCQQVFGRVADRLPLVVAGNFGDCLDEQIDSINSFAVYRPAAVVIVLSTLPRRDNLMDDLMEIARRTRSIPLGIYECPFPEHRLLTADQVKQLAQTGRYVFMKETSRDAGQYYAKMQATRGTPLKVFQANFGALPQSLEDGSDGFCGILANVFPELAEALCNDTCLSNATRKYLHQVLVEVQSLMVERGYPASMKYLLQLRGLSLSTRSLMGEHRDARVEDFLHLKQRVERAGLLKPHAEFLASLASQTQLLHKYDNSHAIKEPGVTRAFGYPARVAMEPQKGPVEE